ncbi:unnamed protein product [Ixodes pacificus]
MPARPMLQRFSTALASFVSGTNSFLGAAKAKQIYRMAHSNNCLLLAAISVCWAVEPVLSIRSIALFYGTCVHSPVSPHFSPGRRNRLKKVRFPLGPPPLTNRREGHYRRQPQRRTWKMRRETFSALRKPI